MSPQKKSSQSRPASGRPSGKSSGKPAGKPAGRSSGRPTGKTSGKSTGGPAGKSGGKFSGKKKPPGRPPQKKTLPSASGNEAAGETVRLQKYLASAGLGSRRHCEEFISAGRVTIDGKKVADLGCTVNPDTQKVYLDGELIRPEPRRYYLLHKPTGVVCTARDPQGRPRAIDLVPRDQRLFTVGRLDENSTGLLLLTNDGELAERLAHPRFQVERIYQVQVAGVPERETMAQLKKGMHFTEGRFQFQTVRLKKTQKQSAFLEVILTEGQNREIRRLFARVGHKVLQLKRIGFGPLRLGRLPEGQNRQLRPVELNGLRQLLTEEGSAGDSRNRGGSTRRGGYAQRSATGPAYKSGSSRKGPGSSADSSSGAGAGKSDSRKQAAGGGKKKVTISTRQQAAKKSLSSKKKPPRSKKSDGDTN